MTPEQQRIAIAEACGIVKQPNSWSGVIAATGEFVALPDYLNDLNAMHEAVMSLTYGQRMSYQENLASVVDAGDAHTYWWEADHYRDKVLNATAPQRAEAFLRTLNLWTES